MPYKDINKRRECNKLAMRRARAKKWIVLEERPLRELREELNKGVVENE